ncbi:MAG: hypothetical protein ABI655_04400 [Phenylobacterium sp.]
MSPAPNAAAALVARALSRRSPEERASFLRELLAHTAAGLVVIEGDRAASEAVYRLADAVVARGQPGTQPKIRRSRMKRAHDPARAARDRLLRLERREKARTEAHAVASGVAETVGLSKARGAAFETPTARREGRETPHRRLSGLDWLLRKGKISEAQAVAGARYGACYRRAMMGDPIASTLEVQPGLGSGGPPLTAVLARADGRRAAQAKLGALRRALGDQPDLVRVCDLICGQEMTVREASGGERDVARLEALLQVALDLISSAGSARR